MSADMQRTGRAEGGCCRVARIPRLLLCCLNQTRQSLPFAAMGSFYDLNRRDGIVEPGGAGTAAGQPGEEAMATWNPGVASVAAGQPGKGKRAAEIRRLMEPTTILGCEGEGRGGEQWVAHKKKGWPPAKHGEDGGGTGE